jgi:hypothetical protein
VLRHRDTTSGSARTFEESLKIVLDAANNGII